MMAENNINREDVGVVVIGRNEGERLRKSLLSVLSCCKNVVYIDSNSSDNSVSIAKGLNIPVLILDDDKPYTAARARNEGADYIKGLYPKIEYVQFLDGDCEIIPQWIDAALVQMNENKGLAVVCGRLRELFPEKTIYNMLCHIEWNTPPGFVKACGGIALMRYAAFSSVNGFNTKVIAGEESELCLRLRSNGWRIYRLSNDMAYHDANITKFSQWWKRNIRGGYAYALGVSMHGNGPERHRVKESIRIWIWGFLLPASIIISGTFNPRFLFLLGIYPLQAIRIRFKSHLAAKNAWFYALFVMLGKFPEFQGQIKYLLDMIKNKKSKIIEYK